MARWAALVTFIEDRERQPSNLGNRRGVIYAGLADGSGCFGRLSKKVLGSTGFGILLDAGGAIAGVAGYFVFGANPPKFKVCPPLFRLPRGVDTPY